METRTIPSIISSRVVAGVAVNRSLQNLSWSDDGQFLIVSRHHVTIATPYILTSLPPPTIPLNYRVLGDPDEEEEEDDALETNEKPAISISRSLARPTDGEVKWWVIAVVTKGLGKEKEEEYRWHDVGDEVTHVLHERDRQLRAAEWSPSGLSRLGGCLLAVMTNTFQVSVYAPGDDTLNTGYEEVADLTMETKRLLGPGEVVDGVPSIHAMLKMRFVAMAWSPQPRLTTKLGAGGSLLALASRAGGIDFWSFGSEGIHRVAQLQLPVPWGSQLAWNTWRNVDGSTCANDLAVTLTDGSAWLVPITRRVVAGPSGDTWDVSIATPQIIGPPDRRGVSALKWVSDSLLVWTKPGSVHIWSAASSNVQNVRLERVGNWAGCNALGTCSGLNLVSPSTLVVVLDSLTYHFIGDILTTPRLLPSESLRATLSARDVFLDCARRRHRKLLVASDREMTANTVGWEGLDTFGDIVTWAAEPMSRHNHDNTTYINRQIDFVAADLKLTDDDSTVPALSALLEDPPSLLYQSPLRVLAPHIFRIVARSESSFAEDVFAVLAKIPPAPDISAPPCANAKESLLSILWGDKRLDSLRLRWILTRWGETAFASMQADYANVAKTYAAALTSTLASLILHWAKQLPQKPLSGLDEELLANLTGASNPTETSAATGSNVACPACGAPITSVDGQAACSNGHEWDRCSVTHLLITTPDYRVCTVCPRICLLPRSVSKVPGPPDGGDELVQIVLEAAIACPSCGGRWSRPM